MLDFGRCPRLPFEKAMAELIRSRWIDIPCHKFWGLYVRCPASDAAILL
jgi:hypothetical protein